MCDTTFADWKPGDSPLERHARLSTKCPLVLLDFPDNSTSSQALGEDSGLLLKARLLTFTKHQFRPLSDTIDNRQQQRRTTRSSSKQMSLPSASKVSQFENNHTSSRSFFFSSSLVPLIRDLIMYLM